MNLNKAIIIGRVTQAPEQKALPSGAAVANFGVATNRVWNDQAGQKQEQVEFHNIVAFGRLAEIAAQYLTKGQLLMVEGRIQTRSWDDQSGQKRWKTEIVAENFQMGPRSQQNSNTNSAQQNNDSQSQKSEQSNEDNGIPTIQQEEQSQESTNQNNEDEIKIEDLPF